MRDHQRRLCEAIAALTTELRRPPTSGEVARRERRLESNTRRAIALARADGLITEPPADRRQYARSPLRLTPAARLEIGLPIVTYLAWPLPHPDASGAAFDRAVERGREVADRVLRIFPGAVPVSPYLVPWPAGDRAVERRLAAGAALLAATCDACVVYRDEILLGRADVAAAVAGNAHVCVVLDLALETPDPWRSNATYPRARPAP